MKITAKIIEIRYRNDSNGWTVFSCKQSDGTPVSIVGTLPHLTEGEDAEFEGVWVEHPIYGTQFKADSAYSIMPKGRQALISYLSGGLISGIREATAKLIVDKFGEDSFDVIANHPEKLTKLSGIGPKRAKLIHDSYVEKRNMQDAMMGMQKLGLSMNMAMKLYKVYGDDSVKKICENPYRLINEIDSIGFKTADEIAKEAGFEHESEFRIAAGVIHSLGMARQEGNTCLPKKLLIKFTALNILNVDIQKVENVVEDMITSSKLCEQLIDGEPVIFLPYLHFWESECAVQLNLLANSTKILPFFDLDGAIDDIEKKKGIRLAQQQREAVKKACTDGILVITGGPGTGKTTILSFIIDLMEQLELNVVLAAPTGRAAKRMTDTTGCEAKTIHRLLEYNFTTNSFNKNSECKLEADVIIVDEMSMVDVPLFYALLSAAEDGTRLVFVGDIDQLPSVGPGNVLNDIVQSNFITVIKLERIYRQAGRSMIVTNAHRINHGQMPILNSGESDFMFYECGNTDIALRSVLDLCYDYMRADRLNDIQVLSPMKNDKLGVKNLNICLQQMINPGNENKDELRVGETLFRLGDRVMQIKNNYDIAWKRTAFKRNAEEGIGIYNGDIGTVLNIDNSAKLLTVLFDDEREVEYNFNQLEELELAYCISVHKSQGSEFPCVVLPLMSGPAMLMNRNILYTAVTRARSNVFILGSSSCVNNMIKNTVTKKRYSALKFFLKELCNE